MISIRLKEQLFLGTIALITIYLGYTAYTYELSSSGTGLTPLIWSCLIIVSAVLRIYHLQISIPPTESSSKQQENKPSKWSLKTVRPTLLFLLSLMFLLTLFWVNYYVAVAIFILASAFLLGLKDIKLLTATALIWLLFVFVIFDKLLYVELP